MVTVRLLKHQLCPAHLNSVKPGESWFFCATPKCAVVYYDGEGGSFMTDSLRLPVTQKSSGRDRPLCYCFGYTEGMLKDEFATTGATTIPDRIKTEIKAGHCACEIRNPQGSCCMGNVTAAKKALLATQA